MEIVNEKTTRANYRQRLISVIDYIHDNINGKLNNWGQSRMALT